MDIPLPQVVPNVGPGGPLVTAMRGDNALSQEMMDTQIKNAQAQYAPYTSYADAASKMAYAQFLGPQTIGNMLTNPATRGMLSPDQYSNLANVFSQQVSHPGFSMANMPLPGRSDGILAHVFNALSGLGRGAGSPPPLNPMAIGSGGAPQMGQGAPQQGSGDSSGYSYDAQGNNIQASPQEINAITNNSPSSIPGSSPTYSRLSGQFAPGTYGAASPGAIQHAGEAGLTAQTQEEAKAIASQWKERQDQINEQSSGYQESERQLDKMIEARKGLSSWEKGPYLGEARPFSSNAQTMDLSANNLLSARLKAWQTGRITNNDISFLGIGKPGRWMNDDSFNEEVQYEKGLFQRMQEYPAFAQRAQSAGLTPAQADAIWVRYANEKPFFDAQSKQINSKNMGVWEDYLDPDSIKQTFSPSYRKQMQKYQSNMAGSDPQTDQKVVGSYVAPISNTPTTIQATATLNGKQYEKINGKWYQK